MTDDTTKRKRGRPKLDRPVKSPRRPRRLSGAVVIEVTLDPASVDALARYQAATGQPSRSAAIRALITASDSS